MGDGSVPWVGANGVRVRSAGDAQIDGRLSGDCNPAGRGESSAVVWANRFARFIRVLTEGKRKKLVEIAFSGQMCAFAADIGTRSHRAACYLVLNIQMPLLHVRPRCLSRNSVNTQGELIGCRSRSDVRIANNLKPCLRGCERR